MNCSFQGLSRATLVQSAMWSTRAKITLLALLFTALGVPEGVAQGSDAAGSVHGSIFTPISLDRVGVIDPPAPSNTAGERILLPDFEVHLIEVSSGQRGGSTKTDLFGRYYLHNQPPGIYRLCWRNRGWIDGCAPDSLTVDANITYMDSQAVLPQLNRTQDGSTRGAIWGRVSLADGTSPWFSDQYFNINQTAEVSVTSISGALLGKALTNVSGEFVVPNIPLETIRILARLKGVQRAVIVPAFTTTAGAPITVELPNRRPIIDTVTAGSAGKATRESATGATLDVVSEVRDLDGDQLTYEWKPAPDSGRILSSSGGSVTWQLDAVPGLKTLYLLVSDDRGGVASRNVVVRAGASDAVFSGRVISTTGVAIPKASIVVNNGIPAESDLTGAFQITAPLSGRYVVNVSAPGFVPASRIYDRSGVFRLYRMAPAFVAETDPRREIAVFDRRKIDIRNAGAGWIRIKPNSLVGSNGAPPKGRVIAQIATIDIGDAEMPGDFGARTASNRESNIISFGALHVEFRDANGDVQQLAPGAAAEVSIPIPAGAINPPAQIALWTYNKQTGYWEELGEKATLDQARQAYLGTVKHLSEINTDVSYDNATCLRILLDNINRDQIKARVTHDSGGTPFTQAFEFVLGDALNVVNRLPENTNVKITVLDKAGNTIGTAQVFTYDPASGQVQAVNNVVNTGPATTPHFPMLPYANCKTASVRLPLPEGSVSRIDFLQFYAGVGALDQAVGYYKGLDPAMVFTADATSPNGGTWSGGNHSTLGAWWALAGFDANGAAADEARAPYLNYNDLGFGRDMHIRKAANGDVFAYVTNYGAADQNPTNADLAQTANKSAALATVAMEAAALTGVTGRVVKFWVYQGGSATGALLNSADLDGFGQKYVPQLCQTCHGGSLYSPITATAPTAAELSLRPGLSSSVGASFREFDVGSFRYAGNSPTPDQALITAFNTLNDFVKDSGPQGAILELIDGWHPTGTPQTTAPNLAFTPPGWTGDPQREQLYHDVVAKSCRTCHVAFDRSALNWNAYSQFAQRRTTIQSFVCGNSKFMPHALMTYRNFWLDTPHAPTALGAFSSTNAPVWQTFGSCK